MTSPQPPAPSPDAVDVAIVGGGIAGLAAAYEVSRRGLSFVVLEGAPRAGGVIVSEEVDGFTIDGGPDALLIQKPEAIALCREIGPVNTARFINHFSTGLGDFTAERAQLPDKRSVDDVVAEIERRRGAEK